MGGFGQEEYQVTGNVGVDCSALVYTDSSSSPAACFRGNVFEIIN